MVLINGVKYACERCIRGHRVTTCTHTDQPLTMIKPKGRPASQCHHCREQRKNKNLHVSCTCGKKGKSPGMHLASCACHKNTHCTCASNLANGSTKSRPIGSKMELSRRRSLLERSASDISLPLETSPSSATINNNSSSQSVSANQSYVNVHSAGNYGNTNTGTATSQYNSDHSSQGDTAPPAPIDSHYVIEDVLVPFDGGLGLFDLFSPSPDISRSNSKMKTMDGVNSEPGVTPTNHPANISTPSTSDMDLSDNMFPLFPLVGTCSFDTTNKPLSRTDVGYKSPPTKPQGSHSSQSQAQTQQQPQPGQSQSYTSHYQPIRPKRPESVLSIASTSSTATNMSKTADGHQNQPFGTSAAFPPTSYSSSSFDLSTINSNNHKATNGNMDLTEDYSDRFGGISDNYKEPTIYQPQTQQPLADLNNLFGEDHDLHLEQYASFLGGTRQSSSSQDVLRKSSVSPTSAHDLASMEHKVPTQSRSPPSPHFPKQQDGKPQGSPFSEFGSLPMFNDITSPLKFETVQENSAFEYK
ncbi:hypothetical protein CAAN1_23S01420 [[Candida] anglica]|uniref:Copper-fist domain-containing protein n=1 Tax=[Candida] anglica TaxID=148631 RepID=A0ABP0EEA1_9ASCO